MTSFASRQFFVAFLLLVLSPGVLSRAATAAWPVRSEGIEPDPAWQWGVLDNGLRYVVRRNAQPAGHVSFRFAVQVGNAHETRAERGFAHFVEHMAFNGTKHFPGETLVADLRKHGLEMGPEVNAFTLLTYTIYDLDAPSTEPAELDHWLTVLRDFADGIKFDAKQVKRERGVIASEIRDHQSAGNRAELARRRFLYPLSALSNSIEGDVERTDAKALRTFYDKWYRPDRMIIVAVGDAEPAKLEAMIRRHFDSLRARAPQPPRFDVGFIENPASYTSAVVHDPRVNGLSVEITSVLPVDATDSLAERRRWLARNQLIYLLNIRLNQVLRKNPGRLLQLSARSTMATPYSIETLITFNAPSAEWQLGVATLEQELRRSFEYTFTPDEINEARAVTLTACEQQVKTSGTRRSSDLAGGVMQQILWGAVADGPEDVLRLAREWLPQIDAVEMNRAWRGLWQQRRARIFAYGFFPARDGSAMLDYAFNESLRQTIAPPAARTVPPFAYTDFGPPGKIKRREYMPDLDIHLLEFENGVRANLKRTTFEAATVHLKARLGRGLLSEPSGQHGLGAMASGTFLNGALGRHPPEELRRILAASGLSLNFSSTENAFIFDGNATSASLEQLLRVVGAYLTDPGWNPQAVALASAQLSTYFADLKYTPEGVIGLNAFRLLSADDPRYVFPTADQVKARTVEELRHWLDPQLRSAPLEIGLVGDLDPEQTADLLARTLGALPARGSEAETFRPVTLMKKSSPHQFSFPGESNRAGIEVMWPVDHYADIRVSRQVELLRSVLSERLRRKVREDLGAAYTPEVTSWKSEANPEDGYLMVYITVKPGDVPRLARLLVDLADNLGRKGASADEFAQAREPILARCNYEEKENGYWLNHIISKIQSQPETRRWPTTRLSDFQSMTVEDLNALARNLLSAPRAMIFSALPERK
jgi:zinc protease